MTPNLFIATLLAGLEGTVNKLLRLDPACRDKLAALNGTLLKIEATAPHLILYVMVHEQGLHLSSSHDDKPDATLRGPALALPRLLTGAGAPSFHALGIEVSGNLDKARQLQRLLSELDIDWEHHLSAVLGDLPTQAVSDSLERGRTFFSQALRSLGQDLDEYLHEEKRLVPGQQEAAELYDDIDRLRLDVDRLRARVSNLSETVNKTPKSR